MREIEIKAKLNDKPALMALFKEKGIQLSEPIIQYDRVFGPRGVSGDNGSNKAPWLRIRTETKNGSIRHLFTLKKSVTNQLDSIEHETEVVDAGELRHIIDHINFAPYSEVKKIRQKGVLGDVEICIDSVEGLGDFIELEKLTTDDANYNEVATLLWGIFHDLGISRKDQVVLGYDVLMKKLTHG